MDKVWKKKQKAHEDDFFQRKEKELLEKLRSKVDKTTEPDADESKPSATPTEKKEEKASWPDDLI